MIEEITSTNVKDELQDASVALIYLTSCAIHRKIPDKQKLEVMDLYKILGTAEFHSLSAISYMALEAADVFKDSDNELARKWKQLKEIEVRKNILLDAECVEICKNMEHEGIWYMPLKGIVLKDLYPKVGMRQMTDVDILFDIDSQQKVRDIMEERGFLAVSVGQANHDIYEKKPVYNFEMHTALYGSQNDSGWVRYYQNVKERLITDENKQFGYHFSDEDFYIYLVTHACRHYNDGGTGLRSLLDIYVYLLEKESSLDWNYMFGELKKLRVADFERNSRELAKKIFSRKICELTEKEGLLLKYFLGSGTYGTLKNQVANRVHEYKSDQQPIKIGAKKTYIIKRLFPEEYHYRGYAPFVYKHRWFKPFYLVYRVIRGVLCNGRNIFKELWLVFKIKE